MESFNTFRNITLAAAAHFLADEPIAYAVVCLTVIVAALGIAVRFKPYHDGSHELKEVEVKGNVKITNDEQTRHRDAHRTIKVTISDFELSSKHTDDALHQTTLKLMGSKLHDLNSSRTHTLAFLALDVSDEEIQRARVVLRDHDESVSENNLPDPADHVEVNETALLPPPPLCLLALTFSCNRRSRFSACCYSIRWACTPRNSIQARQLATRFSFRYPRSC